MFKKIREKASSLSTTLGAEKDVSCPESVDITVKEERRLKINETLRENWQKVESIIYKGLLDIADEKLNDEVFLLEAFEKTYEVLPIPVRLAISRARYTGMCMAMKEKLIVKVRERKDRQL